MDLLTVKSGPTTFCAANIAADGTVNGQTGSVTVSKGGAGLYTVNLPNAVGDGKDLILVSRNGAANTDGGLHWSLSGNVLSVATDDGGVATNDAFTVLCIRMA